jgi:hypothetical protein
MIIEVRASSRRARRAHALLRDRLARAFPADAFVLTLAPGDGPAPVPVRRLIAMERVLYRDREARLCDALDASEAKPGARADIVIDMTGAADAAEGARTLRPLYDGVASEDAMIAALMSGRAPRIAIENAAHAIVGEGLPSLEAAAGLGGGMAAVYSRVLTLLEQAIRDPLRIAALAVEARPAAEPGAREAALFGAQSVARACVRALYHLCCHSPHWRVGWRMHDGPGVLERGDLTGPRFSVVRDSGEEFYADPFPITWRERTFVFVESLVHSVGKGVIRALEFDGRGPTGAAQVVLEEPWHLSYPFLMVEGDQLYMLPEASLSGRVTLYRCVDFPGKWEPCQVLIDNIEAADATIVPHDGRFYMTSVVRDGLGGYSDTLAIYHADSLFGPWREHAMRPVLLDSRAARPAGAFVETAGALWRPVQDCEHGYGNRLRLARVDRLDEEGFAQALTATIASGPLWPGGRLHTLNRAGRLEVIDGVTINPKIGFLRGLVSDSI